MREQRSRDDSVHDLLIGLKRGNELDAAKLFKEYMQKFETCARGYNLSEQEAKDVALETFYKILTRIQGYDEKKGGGQRWIMRICHNTALDLIRRKYRQDTPLKEEAEDDGIINAPADDDWRTDPVVVAERRGLSHAVYVTLGKMSRADQQLLVPLLGDKRSGPRGKARKEAMERFRNLFQAQYDEYYGK